MKSRAISVAIFGLFSVIAHGQTMSLPPVILPGEGTNAMIFAEQTAFTLESARAGHVSIKIIGAYVAMGPAEYPHIVEQKLRAAFEEGMNEAKGISYDDLAKKVGKSVSALGSAVMRKQPYIGGGLIAGGQAIEYGLPLLNTPPLDMKASYEAIVQSNALAFSNMDDKSILGKYLTQAQTAFRENLNPRVGLERNPIVITEREKISAKLANQRIEDQVNKTRQDVRNFKNAQADANSKFGLRLSSMEEILKDVNANETARKDKEITQEEKERVRDEVAGLAGSMRGLGYMTRNPGLIDAANKGANAVEAIYRLSISNFSKNPAAAASAYIFAANCLLDFISTSGNSENAGFTAIMKQLQELQSLLIDIGKRMDQRFDHIDRTLQTYIHNSTLKLEQLRSSTQNIEIHQQEMMAFLKSINQNAYGTYLLLSSLEMTKLTNNCFNKSSISAAEFISCRDQIALFALLTPPLPEGSNRPKFDREVMNSLMERFAPAIGRSPITSGADPGVWLTAVNLLHTLAERYPRHAGHLKAQVYNPISNISAGRIQEAGIYYQSLFRQMAVDPETRKLRRDLIADIIGSYKRAVENAFSHVESLPNKLLPGAPHPKIATYKQEPDLNPNLYPFIDKKFGFCDRENPKIELDGGVSPFPGFNFPALAAQKKWLTEKNVISFDPNVLEILDKSVLFAMTSELKNRNRWNLVVYPCIEKLTMKSQITRTRGSYLGELLFGQSNVYLEIHFKANYLFKDKQKELTVLRLTRHDSFDNKLVISAMHPIQNVWLHYYWAGSQLPPDHLYEDERKVFDAKRPLKSQLKYMVPFTPDLVEFQADFLKEMESSVGGPIDQELRTGFAKYTNPSTSAREELSFLLNYGLNANSPETYALLNWISFPANLPDAATWAKYQFTRGLSANQAKLRLEKRLAILNELLDRVDASPIAPVSSSDIFESALKTLKVDAGLPN